MFSRVLLFGLILLALRATSNGDRPNVIVIFTDDHGYADLSAQEILGDIKTPHIDSLANGGVRMTSGYCSAPQCVPSRAGLLSGRYQNRFGVESNGMPLDGFNQQATIAERLKTVGYKTGMIGKWHLGPAAEITEHGFEDVFYQGGSWTNFDFAGRDVSPGTKTNQLYHLDACSAAAKAFIGRHHESPFFLYVAYRAPHVPLDATQKYLDRFPGPMPQRRRQALAMLSAVDDGVGGIVDSLRQYQIEENTLIFFIGDNGAPLKIYKHDAPGGGPGWDGSLNDPLNGEKGMLSEGGIRVPFVLYWKGKIDAGKLYHHPVISLDVAATAAAVAGLGKIPELDGVNLIPYLTGTASGPPHESLFWRWVAQSAVRQGNWKFLKGGGREYLFDLSRDKEEQRNVLNDHPEVAARLKQQLVHWSQSLQPAGLQTKPMSATWESYFDYYLDGKPAPPLVAGSGGGGDSNSEKVHGWLTRNGISKLQERFLQVRPEGKKGRRPFITASRLSIDGPIQASIRLRCTDDGKVGFAWREKGQNDFSNEQVVMIDVRGGDQMQTYQVTLPNKASLIHLRVLLPPKGADVESILLSHRADDPIQWKFHSPGRK